MKISFSIIFPCFFFRAFRSVSVFALRYVVVIVVELSTLYITKFFAGLDHWNGWGGGGLAVEGQWAGGDGHGAVFRGAGGRLSLRLSAFVRPCLPGYVLVGHVSRALLACF